MISLGFSTWLEKGMFLVGYRGFLHAEMGNGFVTFTELFDRTFPTTDTLTCNDFEFSQVEGPLAGTLAGDQKGHYLVDLTESDVTIYLFHGLSHQGTLDM